MQSPARVGVRTYPLSAVHSGPAESSNITSSYLTNMPKTQIYGACSPSMTADFQNCVSSCVDDVAAWTQSKRLQLNSAKTEVLWCASNRRQHQIPRSGTRISADDVMLSAYIRDLGMYIDADASRRTHVVKTVSSCFARLAWTIETRHSLDSRISRSLNCNRSSMLPLV